MAVTERTVHLNTDAVLTDEMLERLKSERLNVEVPLTKMWHTEVTRDTIRHWAWGIGDDNPLWVDEGYGRASRYGTNLAPPTFLDSCFQGPLHQASETTRGTGLPGLHAIWESEDWEWYRPLLRGTEITTTKTLIDVSERQSKFAAGRAVSLRTRYLFRDQSGELLARRDISFVHFGRGQAASSAAKAAEGYTRCVWSDADLERLAASVDGEWRRGSADLAWDEVEVGSSIGEVVKGPITATELIAFLTGWGGPFIMASEMTHRYIRQHPRANVPDRHTRVPDFPERAHWDGDFARECGFPDGYDFGGQRTAWIANAITNWMGDNATLSRLNVRLTALNLIGDATWCGGSVSKTYIDPEGRKCVDLELTATNQRGQNTARGQATVVAPS